MPVATFDGKTAGKGRRLVIAGGGTGGHLFPGIAVAQSFKARHFDNQVLFVNAGRALEVQVLSNAGWQYRVISIEGIKGRTVWRQFSAALKIPKAIWSAAGLLKSFAPHIVLGVGGYSAGPVVVAAWMMGLPTALHEQNQLPGITNRIVAQMVNRIYLSFEDRVGRFSTRKVRITGNPVRDEILMLGDRPVHPMDPDGFTLLVIGGSQGAHAINEAVIDALPRLKGQSGLKVIHQTGLQDEEMIRKAYDDSGLDSVVQSFFTDIAECYGQADLIIARAGATTVAEITAVGRAAIFIPFPQAADDHQTHNAQALVSAGAAELIHQKDLDGERLADKILHFAGNRSQLIQMAANARSLGRPEAALTIVGDLYALLDSMTA